MICLNFISKIFVDYLFYDTSIEHAVLINTANFTYIYKEQCRDLPGLKATRYI